MNNFFDFQKQAEEYLMSDVTYGKHNYKDGESTLHMASK